MVITRFFPGVKNYAYTLPKSIQYLSYVAGATTLYLFWLSFEHAADIENDLFLFLPRLSYYTAYLGTLLLAALVIAALAGIFFLMWNALDAMGEKTLQEDFNVKRVSLAEVEKIIMWLGLASLAFLFCSAVLAEGYGKYLTGQEPSPDQWTGVAYLLLYYLLPAAWVLWLVRWSPLLAAGWSIARTVHPARSVVERSLSRRRADRAVAAELAAVLRAQDLDDARAASLFNNLSPWQQKVWRAQYAKRTREAAQLRDMVRAQEKAMREEASLAHDVVGMERTRRATYKR